MTMELEIPIEIVFDDINSVIDELGKLQTYKLYEGDDMTLVDAHDVVGVLMRHVKAREAHGMRGRWIAHEGGKFVGFPYMHYECDQCRAFEPTETNFCPNCGADMRGEQE